MLLYILVFLLTIFLIMLAIGIHDANRFVVVNEQFELPGLTKTCRFVFLSDLHNKEYGNHNDIVLEKIEAAQPDFVLFAGDLITDHLDESMEPGLNFIRELSKKYKVYFSYGNHETKLQECTEEFGQMYRTLMDELNKNQVVVLSDESCILKEYGINLTGLNLERKYFARLKKVPLPQGHISKKIGAPKEGYCNILMAHNPLYFEDYADWGADFVLSGHVHGGIMKLPVVGGVISPAYTLFPQYDGGVFHKGKTTMLLGRGMGSHTIPLRFFNPAELIIVELKPPIK